MYISKVRKYLLISLLFLCSLFISGFVFSTFQNNNTIFNPSPFFCCSNADLKNAALAEGIAKAHPLKRVGEGADSASLAKFLITDESSWVTGQVIGVDGGRSTLS